MCSIVGLASPSKQDIEKPPNAETFFISDWQDLPPFIFIIYELALKSAATTTDFDSTFELALN